MTAYLSATLAVNLLLLSAPEATARQRGALPRPVPSAQPFMGLSLAAQGDSDVRALVPGSPIERKTAGGQAHSYRITLASGQYTHVRVEQRGIDVVVLAYAPDGKRLAEIDIRGGTQGEEPVSLIAEASGEYRLEVRPQNKTAAAGHYEIKIEELREFTLLDRSRIAAQSTFEEGKRLRQQGTAESRRKAIEKFGEALQLWHVVSDQLWEGTTLHYIGLVYYSLGEAQTAQDYFNQALSFKRALGDRRGEAVTLGYIAATYSMLGERQKVLDYYLNQILPVYKAIGDRKNEALTLNNIGLVYKLLSEHSRALDYFTEAHSILQNIADDFGIALTLNNIGQVYHELDEYQKAIDNYNQALTIRRALGDRGREANTINNIAAVYVDMGENQKALDHFNQALTLLRAVGDRFSEAASLHNIGRTYSALGDYQKALDYYNQALPITLSLGNRYTEAQLLFSIAVAHNLLNDYQKAIDYFTQALALSKVVGMRRLEGAVLNQIGETYRLLGDEQKALDYFNQALPVSRASKDRREEAAILSAIARIERHRGNLLEARSHIESALSIIESIRRKVASQTLRASYLALNQIAYQFYIDLLMSLDRNQPSEGHAAAALLASERARARSLVETLAESHVDIRQGVDALLLQRESRLQRQINAKAELQMQLLSGKHSEEQAVMAQKELDLLLTEYQEVQAQIRTNSPRYAALTQPQPLGLKEIQQQVLDQNSLLLEYSLGNERSFLWAITPSSFTSHVLPKRAEVETAARRVYELLTARNHRPAGETPEQRAARLNEAEAEYEKAAAALSQMLLGSVATQLGTKRLIIVSEGALQYVPFAALPAPKGLESGVTSLESEKGNNSRLRSPDSRLRTPDSRLRPQTPDTRLPLIVEHEIVTLPSASVLAVLRRELMGRKPAPKAVAVLADPVFRSDDPRIGGAETRRRGDTETRRSEASSLITSPRPRVSVSPPLALAASQTDVERSAKESGVMGFKRLRFSRQEAEAITALAPGGKSLKAIDFAANRATATGSELSRYRVLHFATHGLLNSQHPELSGIVLSLVDERGRPQDGFLRLHEIYNLKLGADLVVLSACQTALGKGD